MTRRRIGILLVVLAIAGLLGATLARRWWTHSNEFVSVSIGLIEMESCSPAGPEPRRYYDYDVTSSSSTRERCTTESLADNLKGEFPRFLWAARIELVLALLAALALATLALLAGAHHRRIAPAAWASIVANAACFVGAIVLVASLPREALELKLAASAYATFAACVVAIAGAGILLSSIAQEADLAARDATHAHAAVAAMTTTIAAPLAFEEADASPAPTDEPSSGLQMAEHAWQRPGSALAPPPSRPSSSSPSPSPNEGAREPAVVATSPFAPPGWQGGAANPAARPAPTMHGIPACPQCTAPTLYVDRHARWFCSSCRLYLQPS